MNPESMPDSSGNSEHGNRRWVRIPHELFRRRAAAAYLRLNGGCSVVAEAIGLRNHSGASRRRQGMDGPLLPLLAEIHSLETKKIDTTPILEAIIETQLDARGIDAGCPRKLAVEITVPDCAEDVAKIDFVSGSGSAAEWRRKLISYLAVATRAVHSLRGVA